MKLDVESENVLRTDEPVFVLRVPRQICMQEDFWCSVVGLPVTSLLKRVAAALVAASVIQSLRKGKVRAAGATLGINAMLFAVAAPDSGGAVVLFYLNALHSYVQRPPRPRVVAFGPLVELR